MKQHIKPLMIGAASMALIVAVIGMFRTDVTAQPPASIRTVPASPQGEWVALQFGQNYQAAHNVSEVYKEPYQYAVLYHTGTGKPRIIKWDASAKGIQTIDAP